MKFCPKCNTQKQDSEFTRKRDGVLYSWCKACTRRSTALWIREQIEQLRLQVFGKLGRHCLRCGFSDIRALQIDHVKGDGYKETKKGISFLRKVLADTTGSFQILCANCNWIKRHEEGREGKPRIWQS